MKWESAEEVLEKLTTALQAAQIAFRNRIGHPAISQARMWDQTDCEHFTLDGIGIAFVTLAPEHEGMVLAEVKRWKDDLENVYATVLREKGRSPRY